MKKTKVVTKRVKIKFGKKASFKGFQTKEVKIKKKKKKLSLGFGLNFRAGNYICPKISKLFQEAKLNYNKFLCGGCAKRTHRNIKTGIWKDELECEQAMVGAMLLNLRFSGMTNKKCNKFLKLLRMYIFSKYKPDEMKLHRILIEESKVGKKNQQPNKIK